VLLNDMADALRAGGSAVEEVAGWIGRNHGSLIQVDSITIHHTATPATRTGDYPSLNTVVNGRSDLPGPLAQLGCGRSGRMYAISNGLAYHAGVVLQSWMDNSHAIGIEVESPGTGAVWPDAQVQGLAQAVASLCKHYGVPASRVVGHKEICKPVGRKIDPVGIPGDMAGFRALVQKYLTGELPVKPVSFYPEDCMYIKCEGKGTALLTGNIFVGLGSAGELNSANANIAKGAPVQWVEAFTWDDLDRRSKSLSNYSTGLPVRVVNDSVNVVDVTPVSK